MRNHIIAFAAGFLLDLAFGDPHWLPHPIRLIGNWIAFLEKKLIGEKGEARKTTSGQELKRGVLLVLAVLSATVCGLSHPSSLWDSCRKCDDLPDSCDKVSESGEHESVHRTEKRRSACSEEGSIHDCWKRYGESRRDRCGEGCD